MILYVFFIILQNFIQCKSINKSSFAAHVLLFYCNRDFVLSLSDDTEADFIEVFNFTSIYLNDILNIENPYFKQM